MKVTYVHLDPSEPLLLSDFGLRQNITRSISTNPAVDVTLFSALSTEQLPDWYTEDLAFDIPDCQRRAHGKRRGCSPEGDIDTRHGRHEDLTTSVESMTV
jgi:hypothetical protein